jgi:hypothetical protein
MRETSLAIAASMTLRCCGTRFPISLPDQEQLVDAGEGVLERGRVVVVRSADGDALRGERFGLGGVASNGDDLVRGYAVEQCLDHEAAQLAGGGGDGNGHDVLPVTTVHPGDAQDNTLTNS